MFDLDGALTDPGEGITKCVQYALDAIGKPEPDAKRLYSFIGPPLLEQFMDYCKIGRKEAEFAVKKYRERFRDKGIYENVLYDGVEEMLKALKAAGKTLTVATSKPEVFASRILKHFQIEGYFELVVGSGLDGTRTKKAEVIEEIIRQLSLPREERKSCLMIGDRFHDIEGGRLAGVSTMGVTFGYGGREELVACRADYVVDSWKELLSIAAPVFG